MSNTLVTLFAQFLNLPKPKNRICSDFFNIHVKWKMYIYIAHARVAHYSKCFMKNLTHPTRPYSKHVSNRIKCRAIDKSID